MSKWKLTQLDNGYQFINGIEMNAELGDRFQVPHPTMKKYVETGHFVELRIDSPRFSVHVDAPDQCECELCHERMTKPILCHEEPESFLEISRQPVPSRGWGEQFWVQVLSRDGQQLTGRIDNTLYESRLHGLSIGNEIQFLEDFILSIHGAHNQEILLNMDKQDLASFGEWLKSQGLLP